MRTREKIAVHLAVTGLIVAAPVIGAAQGLVLGVGLQLLTVAAVARDVKRRLARGVCHG